MKCILISFVVAGMLAMASAQQSFQAGQGVANDHSGNVSFVPRGGGSPYGYGAGTQYLTPLGLTLIAWDIPNSISVVKGLRLNLGCGRFERTYGIDVGAFSAGGEFGGVSANLIGNVVDFDATGLQIGVVNCVEGTVNGVQIGLFNKTSCLHGMQIGLVNLNPSGIFFPILNFGW